MKRALLCVVTGDYLPMALTMAASYAAFHPADDIRILLVGVSAATASGITIESLPLLRVDGADALRGVPLEKMKRYYTAYDMVGVLRSSYIKKILFEEGYDQIVMLDADIFCYAPLAPFFEALERKSIALTPHVHSPIPDDGCLPDDLELPVAGFINNGCCAVRASEQARAALDWLERKVQHNHFFIPEINLYHEQTWVSFLPWYFPDAVELVRDPGCNAAYWNIYERRVTWSDKGWMAGSAPLRFFHYSGYRPESHPRLTTHSERGAMPDGDMLRLLEEYRDKLAEGTKIYPTMHSELSYATESVPARLRRYEAVWGKPPGFYSRYRRSQWLELSRMTREILKFFH